MRKTAECPKCGNTLGAQARYCGCGWKRADETQAPARVQCSHDGCPHNAQIRQRTKTGWANLCDRHYLEHHHKVAQAWSTEHGLDRWPNESSREWHQRTLEYVSLQAKPRARSHIAEHLTKFAKPDPNH